MSWLGRNRVALAVIAVCVPALVGVLFGFEVLSRDSKATEIVTVAADDSVEIAGYTWRLTENVEIAGEGRAVNDIPLGTSIVAALVEVTPTGDSPSDTTCDVSLTSRSSGENLSWRTVGDVSVYGYGRLADTSSFCSLNGEPFELELVFLAPKGVYDSATVEFSLGDSDAIYRFRLND